MPPDAVAPGRHTDVVSQQRLSFDAPSGAVAGAVEVRPGVVWVPGWLPFDGQAELYAAFQEWAEPPAGLRTPHMPDGSPLSIRSVCLGWHWYPYTYSRTCDDHDGAPVKPFPPLLTQLGREACEATGFEPVPFDAAIVNLYDGDAKLGLHQDSEAAEVVERGSPVVTISLGDTCTFRMAGTTTRNRPHDDVPLASGDLLVFGGPARLAYHGVTKVHAGSGPGDLGVPGRISVTLRESGLI
jgi:alkylated DNA repair protein (DNA oxidative demethylase)